MTICLAAILTDINKKFKYRHNTEFRLLNELKLGEEDEIESPRRVLLTTISGSKRGRPNCEHEDWLKQHGKTLSFVDSNDGGDAMSKSISPPRNSLKGDVSCMSVSVFVSMVRLFVSVSSYSSRRQQIVSSDE